MRRENGVVGIVYGTREGMWKNSKIEFWLQECSTLRYQLDHQQVI